MEGSHGLSLRLVPSSTTQYSFRLGVFLSNARHPHRQLPIQRFLLLFGGLHAQCIFNLGRGPKSNACPGHDADAEQGPGFWGEAAVGAARMGVSVGVFLQLMVVWTRGCDWGWVKGCITYLQRDIVQLTYCAGDDPRVM